MPLQSCIAASAPITGPPSERLSFGTQKLNSVSMNGLPKIRAAPACSGTGKPEAITLRLWFWNGIRNMSPGKVGWSK